MSTHQDPQSVRDLAYQLWVERGCPDGGAEADWFEAERRLLGGRKTDTQVVDEAVKESFPASDPPATGLPDKPPANAEEKWRAAESSPTPGESTTPSSESPASESAKKRRTKTAAPAAATPVAAGPASKPQKLDDAAASIGRRKPRETPPKLGSRDAPGG